MLEGPSFKLYEEIISACSAISQERSLKLIASGGISTTEDLVKLREIGCEGAIIGKAIYENRISLKDLSDFLS